jgi:hypothetical protein
METTESFFSDSGSCQSLPVEQAPMLLCNMCTCECPSSYRSYCVTGYSYARHCRQDHAQSALCPAHAYYDPRWRQQQGGEWFRTPHLVIGSAVSRFSTRVHASLTGHELNDRPICGSASTSRYTLWRCRHAQVKKAHTVCMSCCRVIRESLHS